MRIYAIVKRKGKMRRGRGFSGEELREVGLSFAKALNLGIPIDTRRSTKHEENVKTLKDYVKKLKLKLTVEERRSN